MRLVLDEHLSPAIAEELRNRGHDVIAATDTGLGERSDSELLHWAVQKRRAIVTANYADFRTLHEIYLSRRDRHFGIVLVPRRYSFAKAGLGRLIRAVEHLLMDHADDDALESVETWLTD